jgi:glyoxylase-like metal-dependent hydrolase (beta-lactamase superfamily II)
VRVNQKDPDYWLDSKNENEAPAFLKRMFEGDRTSLAPYLDSGSLRPFKDGEQLSPEIRAVPTFGHTPGHTSYEVTNGLHRLLVWGDLVHVAPIQFPDPAVTVTYDRDPLSAEARRMAAFSEAARTDTWIAAAHIAFSGLGHVRATGGRCDYTTVLRP